MPQCYLHSGDTLFKLVQGYKAGQTFHPESDFILEWVDLQMRGGFTSMYPFVELFLAGADHKPWGARLSYQTAPYYKWLPVFQLKRIRLPMLPYLLEKDTKYAILVSRLGSLLEDDPWWQYDAGDATYARGLRISSLDGGDTWTVHFDDDHLFAVFGTPPAPPPPPEPPVENWAIIDIEQIITATGYKIIATTNVPCHLYFYWTTHEPNKHKRTIIQRGLTVPAASQYCFVDWHKNEQSELGDTIYHTFVKEPWPSCETRWFVFRAKIDNEWSPSISPIFKKHRLYVPPPWGPPIEETYLADTDDGYLATWRGFPFMTYIQNWNAETCWVGDFEQANSIFNDDYNNVKSIYRGVLFFDTSTLPANCLIISAYVRLNTFATDNPRGASLCLTPATNVNKPLIAADYHALLDTPTIIAIHPFQNMTVPPGMILNLTEEGLTHITKAGITKFATRIDFEIVANGSPDSHEAIRYNTQEGAPASVRPVLVVTYKLPL